MPCISMSVLAFASEKQETFHLYYSFFLAAYGAIGFMHIQTFYAWYWLYADMQ